MNCKLFWTAFLGGLQVLAAPTEIAEVASLQPATAPPTPPPILRRDSSETPLAFHSAAAAYSIGDPTPEEQLYVELINRARANPAAEAAIFANTTDSDVLSNYRFFNLDLALMLSQFAAIPAAPPVALNAELSAAARRQSGDMLTNSYQGHVGSDGSTFDQRITQAGYNYSTIGENVYSTAHSVFHGHAGFDVDWGTGPGGMQTPPGHRTTIHNPAFREVGVGVLFGNNTPAPGSTIPGSSAVGPQIVTQEFGTRQSATPLITGVAYFDLNGNSFYDIGEGIGGIQVTASGTARTAVTARSGGYTLPVAGNGTYTITFSADGLAPVTRQVTVSDAKNQKLDLLPAYMAPTVAGTTNPVVNQASAYEISQVPAAAAYQWRSFQLIPAASEGAENGTANVTIQKHGTYEVFETATRASGSYSFHLAHPQGGIEEQIVLLNPNYVINANSTLNFASRLGWATDEQTAKVQVSVDNGQSWQDVYAQAGTTDAGELSFRTRSVSLAPFAGKTARIRFNYAPSGLAYIDTDAETGWFIDDISLQNVSQIGNEQVRDAQNRTFSFQPAELGSYVLQARALTGHEYLPWGNSLSVQSREGTAGDTELRVSAVQFTGGQLELQVDVLAGTTPATVAVESKATLNAPWQPAVAMVQATSPTRFRVTLPIPSSGSAFFRIKAG